MRKISLVLALCLLMLSLVSCGGANMKALYDANTLENIFKTHSSFTLTTTFADGRVTERFYQPSFAYFSDDAKATVYLSSGCYSHSDGKYYIELFTDEDYSYHMLKERYTAPLIAQNAKVSYIMDTSEGNELLSVKTRPSDAYNALLYEEYGVKDGKFTIVYNLNAQTKEYVSQLIYLNDELYAEITATYDQPRPQLAQDLYSRLTAPANQCRTVTVTLDPHHPNQRSVIGRTVKGDSFKLNVPEGYKSAFANHQCTIPYSSKGADKDAEIFLVYGQ